MGDTGSGAALVLGVGETAGGPAAVGPASDTAAVVGGLADVGGIDITLIRTGLDVDGCKNRGRRCGWAKIPIVETL